MKTSQDQGITITIDQPDLIARLRYLADLGEFESPEQLAYAIVKHHAKKPYTEERTTKARHGASEPQEDRETGSRPHLRLVPALREARLEGGAE